MAKQTFTTGQVLTAAQMTALQQTAMLGGDANARTASYVLLVSDAGNAVTMSSTSTTTITVNSGIFEAGDIVTIVNINSGISTITAGTATVTTSGSLALSQNQGGILRFTSASAAIFLQFATPASGDIEGVTAGTGISGGGTSGTVTITNSMATAIDAKGDLVVGTGADAFSRLAVGTNDYVLTAASGEATGLKWAAASAASGPAFKARRTADQNVPTANTWVKVQFNAEVYDTDNCFDSTTNYRFTPTKAGYYQFNTKLYFPINSNFVNFCAIYKNGTVIAQSNAGTNGSSANMAGPPGVSDLQSANGTTDYFEVYALSTSTGNDIGGGAEQVTYFSGVWIRGL